MKKTKCLTLWPREHR